jgi:hypothetical protein
MLHSQTLEQLPKKHPAGQASLATDTKSHPPPQALDEPQHSTLDPHSPLPPMNFLPRPATDLLKLPPETQPPRCLPQTPPQVHIPEPAPLDTPHLSLPKHFSILTFYPCRNLFALSSGFNRRSFSLGGASLLFKLHLRTSVPFQLIQVLVFLSWEPLHRARSS